MTRARTPPDVNQAQRCLQVGNLDEAERISQQLLKRNRRDANAVQLLGSIAMARGAYDKAAGHFRTCVRLKPAATGPHFLYGKGVMSPHHYSELEEPRPERGFFVATIQICVQPLTVERPVAIVPALVWKSHA